MPPAQRSPSPNGVGRTTALPCRKIESGRGLALGVQDQGLGDRPAGRVEPCAGRVARARAAAPGRARVRARARRRAPVAEALRLDVLVDPDDLDPAQPDLVGEAVRHGDDVDRPVGDDLRVPRVVARPVERAGRRAAEDVAAAPPAAAGLRRVGRPADRELDRPLVRAAVDVDRVDPVLARGEAGEVERDELPADEVVDQRLVLAARRVVGPEDREGRLDVDRERDRGRRALDVEQAGRRLRPDRVPGPRGDRRSAVGRRGGADSAADRLEVDVDALGARRGGACEHGEHEGGRRGAHRGSSSGPPGRAGPQRSSWSSSRDPLRVRPPSAGRGPAPHPGPSAFSASSTRSASRSGGNASSNARWVGSS